MNYIDNLIAKCNEAKISIPINEFTLQNLSDLKQIKKAIYIIEQVRGNPIETFEKLKAYKNKKERSCPKLNAPSNILYVGSSTTGLYNRIKQHMGDGHKGTYALHLKQWFDGDYKITIKQYDKSREVIQIIEDELSYQLKPAFGKQGGNNK